MEGSYDAVEKVQTVSSTYLVGAAEERLSCVHLYQDASQRPHVDSQVIRHSQKDLRRAVKPALYVLIDLGRRDRWRRVVGKAHSEGGRLLYPVFNTNNNLLFIFILKRSATDEQQNVVESEQDLMEEL